MEFETCEGKFVKNKFTATQSTLKGTARKETLCTGRAVFAFSIQRW